MGADSDHAFIVTVGDLQVFQDDTSATVWSSWGSSWRDVVILDADNVAVYRFNLSTYDLGTTSDDAHIKAVFVAVAQGTANPLAREFYRYVLRPGQLRLSLQLHGFAREALPIRGRVAPQLRPCRAS